MTKHIFITGGVVSGLGKGITAASLGRLLKQRGLRVAAQKLDPYLNIDPGSMNPLQHGEVFVTDDGTETDLDLGHYERFIDESLTRLSSLTSGKVYRNVLQRERDGDYQGGTVQVIPHVTNEIKDFINAAAEHSGADVLITEIGGTIGDIECQPYIEAIRQISLEKGSQACLFVHVTLVPFLRCSGEHKSKPTQHSVKELRAMGISPNIIVARVEQPLPPGLADKISLFCNVKPDCVIENLDLPSLYQAPLMLHENGMDAVVCRELGWKTPEPDLTEWRTMVDNIFAREREIEIAIVGDYVLLHDAYLSVIESLNHAGFSCGTKVKIRWVNSAADNMAQALKGVQGIVLPGENGSCGDAAACAFSRENNIPLLGIGVGETCNHPQQRGAFPCKIVPGTKLHALYGCEEISERFRGMCAWQQNDMIACVTSPKDGAVQAMELPGHPFYVSVQYHPQFKSRPNKPHPLFLGLVQAALDNS
ncbi:MAG: CTP synthase [Oscillospiraceae bacterium]|nr:CTP synthase [Oscillospiraceae bacterium]